MDVNAPGPKVSEPSGALSRASPDPLYRQLARYLESAIGSGRLKPGERLDSESMLAAGFDVSRITVRQALDELVRKRLVVRKQGKGTFVTAPAVRHDLRRLHGLLGSLFSQADTASAQLLRYELRVPPRAVRERLQLGAGQRALALYRLYLIGGRPVALGEGWLAPQVGELARSKAELLSTEDLMRAVGIRIASTQVSIRAEPAGMRVGRFLKVAARAPLLVLRRDAFGEDGVVKETGCVFFRSDSYELVCATSETGAAEGLFDIRNVEARA